MNGLKKGSKKLTNAWAFYDWANSVYSLVISTAIFPIYYSSITSLDSYTNAEGNIYFLGGYWNATSLYDYAMAFSFLIVAFISPILSGIADYTGNKLIFLKRFCLFGALSVMCLSFFNDNPDNLFVAIVFIITASIGFWGSIVFYNAYLPEVAFPEQQDKVSAKGFIFGYIGSMLLLILCLVLIEGHEFFSLDKSIATRLSFILVGLWWLGFAQITYKKLAKLPTKRASKKSDHSKFWNGFKELKKVTKELKGYPSLRTFLVSFFFFSIGVQTIILMGAIFGEKELELPTINLILTILLMQIVAIFGAYIFSNISEKWGNIIALKISLVIWCLVCFSAFLLDKDIPNVEYYFYGLGSLIGLVLGATQSLARSTYSKLLPETEDTATYFSFFDVTEKIAIVVGMVVFGSLIWLTGGSMQWSVLSLAVFFIISLLVLHLIKKTKHIR